MSKVLALVAAVALLVPAMALGQDSMSTHQHHGTASSQMHAKMARKVHRKRMHNMAMSADRAKFNTAYRAKMARKVHRKRMHNMAMSAGRAKFNAAYRAKMARKIHHKIMHETHPHNP